MNTIQNIKSKLITMTCDVEHTWLNPKLYQILQTRYKYLRVAQAFKNQFSSEKTYSCKLDLKRLKHSLGSRVGLSVFIYTPNSKPQAAQITKSLFS